MSDDVPYADQRTWIKEVMKQPRNVLGHGTKVVLAAIWEAMDKKTGITTRLQSTIADATGRKTGTVKRSIAAARKAGFLKSTGKGGHTYEMAYPEQVEPGNDNGGGA